MKLISKTLVIVLFMSSMLVKAQEATDEHKDSLNAVVDAYYEINLKIFQSGSTVQDIDEVFALFTNDFTYVHPKYGGTYTRQDLYNGYTRNQKNGSYDGGVTAIREVKRITGLNAVVVERIYVTKEEGKTEEGDPQMTLFEFRDGKISRIFEYW